MSLFSVAVGGAEKKRKANGPSDSQTAPPKKKAAVAGKGIRLTDERMDGSRLMSTIVASAAEFLESISADDRKKFIQKDRYKLADIQMGTVITVHSLQRVDGKYGAYPLGQCDFEDKRGAELIFPSRYEEKMKGRETPFLMIHAGPMEHKGTIIYNADFVDMVKMAEMSAAE